MQVVTPPHTHTPPSFAHPLFLSVTFQDDVCTQAEKRPRPCSTRDELKSLWARCTSDSVVFHIPEEDGTTRAFPVTPRYVALRVACADPPPSSDERAIRTALARSVQCALSEATTVTVADWPSGRFRGNTFSDDRGVAAKPCRMFYALVAPRPNLLLRPNAFHARNRNLCLADFLKHVKDDEGVGAVTVHDMLRVEAQRLLLLGSCRIHECPERRVDSLSGDVGKAAPFDFFGAPRSGFRDHVSGPPAACVAGPSDATRPVVRAVLTDRFGLPDGDPRAQTLTTAADADDDGSARRAHIVFVWTGSSSVSSSWERATRSKARDAYPDAAVVLYPAYLRNIHSERRMKMGSARMPATLGKQDLVEATRILCTMSFAMGISIDRICTLSAPKRAALMVNHSLEEHGWLPLPYKRVRPTSRGAAAETYRGGLIELCGGETFFCAKEGDDRLAVHIDFSSFYPTIMAEIGDRGGPSSGLPGGLMQRMIRQKRSAPDGASRKAYKLGCNTVYGSLGSPWSALNSRDLAEKITEWGRHHMTRLRAELAVDAPDTRVVMGHTDSWIAIGSHADIARRVRDYNRRHTHVSVDIEDHFSVLLAPNTQYAACSLTTAGRVVELCDAVRQLFDDGLSEVERAHAGEDSDEEAIRDDLIVVMRRCKERFNRGGVKVQSLFDESKRPAQNLVAIYAWAAVMAAILADRDGEGRASSDASAWRHVETMVADHQQRITRAAVAGALWGVTSLDAGSWRACTTQVASSVTRAVMSRVRKTNPPDAVRRRLEALWALEDRRPHNQARGQYRPDEGDVTKRLIAWLESEYSDDANPAESGWTVDTVVDAFRTLDVERTLDEDAKDHGERGAMAALAVTEERRKLFRRAQRMLIRMMQ